MMIVYLMIGTFIGGWLSGATYKAGNTISFWEGVGTVALCITWPFTVFLMFKMWREGKL